MGLAGTLLTVRIIVTSLSFELGCLPGEVTTPPGKAT